MAFVPTTDGVRIVVKYSQLGQAFTNVFHASKTDFSTADMQALADDIDLTVGTQHMVSICSDVLYQGTDVYDIRSVGGEIVNANAESTLGSHTEDVLPINTACVVTLRTATRGRSGRGRIYVGGLRDTDLVDGAFTATPQLACELYVERISDAATANGFVLGVRSQQQNEVLLNPAVIRPITSWEVRDARPGTQRRRIDRS